MQLSRAPFLLVIALAVGLGFAGGQLHAQKKAFAKVAKGSALCTRSAPSGKAWVTPYVEGQNAWLGRLDLAAGAKVPTHRDPTEEYIHVLSGHGTMTIDGTRTQVGPGDTIYMPAGAEVSFENGRENLSALQVFAAPTPAAKYDTWAGCK